MISWSTQNHHMKAYISFLPEYSMEETWSEVGRWSVHLVQLDYLKDLWLWMCYGVAFRSEMYTPRRVSISNHTFETSWQCYKEKGLRINRTYIHQIICTRIVMINHYAVQSPMHVEAEIWRIDFFAMLAWCISCEDMHWEIINIYMMN